ncbi:MAG TPA: class I mannose-6-phosphate isomerase [Clostridia bacterium]|jgi:mannose-6-phosphate isomerase class I|nr:class I mannose-6-phosphate isomerase [Clostridia bacterium]HQO55466.1 class I mannose-6-phosphate isomerase [Clostridia bacterium]HUM60737.1 class I mannose-6-phosphate isomerase [Clostridia bacterium]
MSFMFHPFPYVDPDAINPVELPSDFVNQISEGVIATAGRLVGLIEKGAMRIGIDGFPGAPFDILINCMLQKVSGRSLKFIDASSLLKSPEEISAILKPYLPENRGADPVLLYGVRYLDGYTGLHDANLVNTLKCKIETSSIPIIVYGRGALCEELVTIYDARVWMDITPRSAVLKYKQGYFRNLGANEPLSYALGMRRNYYVDFEIAIDLRWKLIKEKKLDYYISADNPENMWIIPYSSLLDLFCELNSRPFRCRPVYLEGVWGGFFMHRLRHLPKNMRNCAWIFDLIPMEVSIVARWRNMELEAPFFTFVQVMGESLLGRHAFEKFGGYFPVRFNYDDTYHSSGNMSIQCHPDAEYVMKKHGELGRQDESYYICVASQGAKTFLGFQEEDSCKQFFREARRVEHTGEKIDYQRYIHSLTSVPGMQVLIPAGTVHASGRNQVILEIGSLTMGSYTYKLYDYQRIDPQTGKSRPIHLKMGGDVIRGERTANWVQENLVNHGGVIREGEGYLEKIVGEHELLYFSLRNLIFEKEIKDNTDGAFHVLALVDGECVCVESIADPTKRFTMNFLEIIVVPASLGGYRLINKGVGTVTVHKTLLKKE